MNPPSAIRNPPSSRFLRASFFLLLLANVAVLFSIAASQILLGASLGAFLLARRQPAWAPLWPPLLVYMGWTLVSLVLAAPVARGLPQVKKFYIFAILLLGYTLFRQVRWSEVAVQTLFVGASMGALYGMVEFVGAYLRPRDPGVGFYTAYAQGRITGFMSHWMTFGGEEMLVLMMLVAWLISGRKTAWWVWLGAVVMAVALLLSFTRGVWLGCLAGVVYLLWPKRRRWVLAMPVAALVLYMVSPTWLQMRVQSIFILNQDDNSTQARLLMWKAGLAMVRDRPLLGVGPDSVPYEFERYRPKVYKPPAWYGHLHNDYLEIAAERGLPALAAFLWLMVVALRDQHRLSRRVTPAAGAWLANGAAAATIALMVAGLFEYNFGDSEVAMLWLFLIAHGYATRDDLVIG